MPIAEEILVRDGFKCVYCGRDLYEFEDWVTMVCDHRVPKAHEGRGDLDNFVTCCGLCNTLKGHRRWDSLQETTNYIEARREEWLQYWQEHVKPLKG
jgi:5-methylcytosine-specific restriction endonuclease McrA